MNPKIVTHRTIAAYFSISLASVLIACTPSDDADAAWVNSIDMNTLDTAVEDIAEHEVLDSDAPIPTDGWGLILNPRGGTFTENITITISPRKGVSGDIRFTTDGTPPSVDSPMYTAPVEISGSTEINAAIFREGHMIAWGGGVFVKRADEIALDLPIIVMHSPGHNPAADTFRHITFLAFDTHDGASTVRASPDVFSRAVFRLRGQSSRMFDKTPYRIELRDMKNRDLDWPVLGMPSESDWVLRGPYVDKSLIREALHYDIGREIGMVAPQYRFCELFVNHDNDSLATNDYAGVYMLVETIKNSKNRLDLKQLDPSDTEPDDVSGGYIFKFEWQAWELPLLPCPGNKFCWSDLEIVDPFNINTQQKNWLSNHLYEFSQALHTSTLLDAINGYGKYINIQSFADQVIMNEIGREADSYIRSAFFHKDRNDVIVAGPLWDYNLSLGTGFDFMGTENLSAAGWMYEVNNRRNAPSNDWFYTMMQDPQFKAVVSERWQELRRGILSENALRLRIDMMASRLENAAHRNFERWPNLETQTFEVFQSPVTETWEEQISWLKDWLMWRIAWMDSQWL